MPGATVPLSSSEIIQIKEDLQILHNARYHSSTGRICGDEETILQLKEAQKCTESCEVYGGECKTFGLAGEIEIQGIGCGTGKKCFVRAGQNLEKDSLEIKEFQVKPGPSWESAIDQNNILIQNIIGGTPVVGIKYSITGENFCSLFRTNLIGLNKNFFKKEHNFYFENLKYNQDKQKLLLIAAYPMGDLSKSVYKNVLMETPFPKNSLPF
jgi:hypothetical protein